MPISLGSIVRYVICDLGSSDNIHGCLKAVDGTSFISMELALNHLASNVYHYYTLTIWYTCSLLSTDLM